MLACGWYGKNSIFKQLQRMPDTFFVTVNVLLLQILFGLGPNVAHFLIKFFEHIHAH